MKAEITLTIEFVEGLADFNDNEEIDWVNEQMLNPKNLTIHSEEIGDWIADVVEVKEYKIKFL